VTGIGAVRAKRITDAWAEQKVVREIMVFLHSNGVGTARAVRIFKTYGADAVQVMTENPYRLARDIRGIGFKSADAIAMKLGIEKTAMIRLRAGISYALTEAMDEGHCGLPTDQLIPLAEELLEAPRELILTALELERSEGAVIADEVGDTACIFLAGLYRAEQAVAERLIRIVSGRLPWPWIDEEKALPWVEKRSGLQLADSQRAAIRLALMAKALVITGGPGVGKTTIVNSILKILAAKSVKLLLCAPTGRAAKRMTEATGVEAKTIHRLLEVDPRSGGFKRNADNPLDCDLLVVDEASMVDVMLMQALMKAIPDHAALLIVGDIDQLPSVGPGHVLADIIGSGAVSVVDRGVPASRREPHHHQRPSHQSGRNARSQYACRRQRLLLRSGRRSRDRRSTHLGIGEDPHPQTLRLKPDPRHPGALSDESRRRRRAFAQHRIAGGVEPRWRAQGRAFRMDLCAWRQGHADRE
jgi:exodeoxyribonuclease V alpha subunit